MLQARNFALWPWDLLYPTDPLWRLLYRLRSTSDGSFEFANSVQSWQALELAPADGKTLGVINQIEAQPTHRVSRVEAWRRLANEKARAVHHRTSNTAGVQGYCSSHRPCWCVASGRAHHVLQSARQEARICPTLALAPAMRGCP